MIRGVNAAGGAANAVENSLLRTARLWTRDEVLARPSPVPPQAGVYAWYFRAAPGGAPIAHVRDGLALLYVGISPAIAREANSSCVSASVTTTAETQQGPRFGSPWGFSSDSHSDASGAVSE